MPEATIHAMPIRVKLECPQCHAEGEGTCRCGVPYIPARARVEAALAENPNRSDRVIAAEAGSDAMTVNRVRRRSTVTGVTAEPRVGRDGRTRRVPTPAPVAAATAQAGRRAERDAEAIRLHDAGRSNAEIVQTTGIHDRHLNVVLGRERVRREARDQALNELEVNPSTLSQTAQGRLEAARRVMERQLSDQQAARMRQLDEEVRQRVVAEGARYRERMEEREREAEETVARYRSLIANHRFAFTADQFMAILKCLHPDNSASAATRATAFRLFNERKAILTGER